MVVVCIVVIGSKEVGYPGVVVSSIVFVGPRDLDYKCF